jgi:hypothetical protein
MKNQKVKEDLKQQKAGDHILLQMKEVWFKNTGG